MKPCIWNFEWIKWLYFVRQTNGTLWINFSMFFGKLALKKALFWGSHTKICWPPPHSSQLLWNFLPFFWWLPFVDFGYFWCINLVLIRITQHSDDSNLPILSFTFCQVSMDGAGNIFVYILSFNGFFCASHQNLILNSNWKWLIPA